MADNYTLRIRSGDTYNLVVTYRDPENVPINLTGYTYLLHVSVGDVEDDFTGTPEITVATPSNGQIALKLTAAKTATYATGRGRFYLRITSSGGDVTTLLEGDVSVEFNE